MNSKLKCTNCKEYFPANTMLIARLVKYCSKRCKSEHEEKRKKKAAKTASKRTQKTAKEIAHLDAVASLGCIACSKLGFHHITAEIHHIRHGMGVGQRNNHFATIPLCSEHHRTAHNAFHMNKTLFEQQFGTELQLLNTVAQRLAQREQVNG